MPVRSDDFAVGHFFKVTLDGDNLKEETHFRDCRGLDVYIDCVEVQEGGKNDAPHKLPGAARFSNIVLKRGVTRSRAFFNWIADATNRKVKRMGGMIALCNPDGTPIIEWAFEKGWPCHYEGPRLDTESGAIALEAIEIAHEGIKMQPGGGGGGPAQA